MLTALNIQAQPPADSTPTYPQGATYMHSSGTATIIDSYSSSTQYYNVIQCTGGTLTMNGCTITKTGDGSGGGTVTVNGGTATANGSKSAVIYSTGTMSATDLVGTSAKGEIAVIEGDNSIAMTNCTMTSGSSERGLLMMQSGSGDASGSGTINETTGIEMVNGSQLMVTGSDRYDMLGRRVNDNYKGIVIQKGKKVVIK